MKENWRRKKKQWLHHWMNEQPIILYNSTPHTNPEFSKCCFERSASDEESERLTHNTSL